MKLQADHSAVSLQISELAPNRKAMERGVCRLRRMPGVVSAGLSEGRMIINMRNPCVLLTRAEGYDAFQEEGLVYTRIVVAPRKNGVATWINRANFSLHALERFVERSDCRLGVEFLSALDSEAVAMLRGLMAGGMLDHGDGVVAQLS